MIKTMSNILEKAKLAEKKKIVVVAAAEDEHVLGSLFEAKRNGIVDFKLVGDKDKIENIAKKDSLSLDGVYIVDEKNPIQSCKKAVEIIKAGDGDILMKGMVSTADLLRALLNKEYGLKKSSVLSHVALFQSPYYHKLLGVTDAAMNVAPTLEEKVEIINNAATIFHALGIDKPKMAVIGAVEVVNPKMPPTTEAALLTMMNKRGQIKGCEVDGPLALDNAISIEAAKQKKIESSVAGDADCIITPDIEAGNVLYKSLNFLGGAVAAAVIVGAQVPVVLTSRADSEESKMLSIALASIL
ncbi:bifunctional enoyl-CoA hydratase/phosphate acetyltransferase [bacterium]|nr:bifunctional enoyl-CoA hydratase/phosphate acetyltransferase [bacterium]